MEYVNLGRTGLRVSRICLGMMSFGDVRGPPVGARRGGGGADRPRARSRAASPSSTPPTSTTAARARSLTGRLLREAVRHARGVRARDQGVHGRRCPGENGRGLSRKHILASIDASLARLGLDYVDLYQIHRWDYRDADRGDDGGAARRRQGRQGALHRREQHVRLAVREGAARRRAHGWTRFVSMQNHYNLVYREEEREMIPQCIDQGVGVMPWSPLARGLLAGNRTREGERLTTRARHRPVRRLALHARASTSTSSTASPRSRASAACRRRQVALAWLLHKPGVTAPIVGATKRAAPRGRTRRRAARR